MSQHTPEPWRYGGGAEVGLRGVPDRFVRAARGIIVHCSGKLEEARANAARIVACVNAMAGIKDPGEFMRVHREIVEALRAAVRVLSHIKDSPTADPLKYVPLSAYRQAYEQVKQALSHATQQERTP